MIDRAIVEKVAHLSRLALTEEEAALYAAQLSDIMETMEVLQQIDTEGVEPLAHVLPIKNVLRSDEVGETLPKEKVLANAPNEIDGMFGVPKNRLSGGGIVVTLARLTIHELHQKLVDREISATELTKEHLERIKSLDETVHAYLNRD